MKKKEHKTLKAARQSFQSNLKASRIHYRRDKKVIKNALSRKRFIMRRAEKNESREERKEIRETYREDKDSLTSHHNDSNGSYESQESRHQKQIGDTTKALKSKYRQERIEAKQAFSEAIRYVSPSILKPNEIKKFRLPPAKERHKVARKNLANIGLNEKKQGINPKFRVGLSLEETKNSRFHFQSQKSLERLQAEKEVKSSANEIKQLKTIYKHKTPIRKVKNGLNLITSEMVDIASQDDDLEGVRTVRDTTLKSKRYARFTYDAGKAIVKSGKTGGHITKRKFSHVQERFRNFNNGKGWTRTKPLKPRRRYQTFMRLMRNQSMTKVTRLIALFKGSLTFFINMFSNPMAWVVSGIILIAMIMISFVMSISGTSLIQQDEIELTKSYTHLTLVDAEKSLSNEKGITYYTKLDDIMAFMNHQYQDYQLNEKMDKSDEIYQDFLTQLWEDLNSGTDIKSMKDLYDHPKYKLSEEDQEELKELTEEGNYLTLQELDNPFQGQTEEDTITMTYRYGYDVSDDKPVIHHHIILQANQGQVIVAPMDGKVSLKEDQIIIRTGKGNNKRQLTLFNIATGRVSEGQKVLAGDIIGELKDGSGLKVTYQKVDEDSENLTYVNPAFYFPRVIQLQTTILPTIGQFGGDEFGRAKAIYEFLKAKGASNQAIAGILGNWSVESGINPKRAEGDYLSPPVGASDSSWDDPNWLGIGGPAIYNGRYPNILRRGLGLGQWTDTADGSRRHTLLVEYAKLKNRKWYDLELQLDFMMTGDNPYYTTWLKSYFKNTGSPASLAQLFLNYWEGNAGDKLLERQTRATEWFYQIEKGFSQPNGGTAQSDPKALEAVRGDLYDNSIPGGGNGMNYAYGQCTWGVAARMNQLGLQLKGKNGNKIPITGTMGNGQDWVRSAASLGGETGTIPRAGAIISFQGGTHGTPVPYGHVSFVEKVYPDGSFLISETNFNGNPNYTFRKLSGVDAGISFAYTTK